MQAEFGAATAQSAAPKRDTFPKSALLLVFGIIAAVLATVAVIRDTDRGPRDLTDAVRTLPIRFEDRADGAVVVRTGTSARPTEGEVLQVFDPGTNGFVRGALRGLVRERKRREIGPEVPFVLVLWPSGLMSLEDPTTNNTIDLSAFGPSNAAPFVQILSSEGGSR